MRKSPSSTSTGGVSSKLPSPCRSCHQPHHMVSFAGPIPPLAAIHFTPFSLALRKPLTLPRHPAEHPVILTVATAPTPAPHPQKYRSKRISWLGAPRGYSHSPNVDHHNSSVTQFVSAYPATHASPAKAILSSIISTHPTCVYPSGGRSIARLMLITLTTTRT